MSQMYLRKKEKDKEIVGDVIVFTELKNYKTLAKSSKQMCWRILWLFLLKQLGCHLSGAENTTSS